MEKLNASLYLIVLFPLLGSILSYLAGRVMKNAAGIIATLASAASFAAVVYFVFELPQHGFYENRLFTWFASDGFTVDFLFRMDTLTAVMCLVITGIGSLIHLYSIGYMAEDPSRPRFFAYLNLFMFSMLILVLGGNLPVLFVGWEGVGLCSYLLIGFWHTNIDYASAGKKAFIVNRIGDAGFLIGMFLLIHQFGTLDFLELRQIINGTTLVVVFATVVAVCFFIGATGKSAQIPLFVWLPDAMAGPTPVSALIHAATMVTAGVYLLARMHFLFSQAPGALALVAIIAAATALVAAATALVQNDIKKVLAYSTVSQLGFMFMAASAGAYWVAIFHVVTHAFFKACLFLGAGSVIHGCHHEQDMRHMGGLAKAMPITFITYAISTLAIAGLYPFAGYQSKHAIMQALEHHPYLSGSEHVIVILASFTAFLTAFYMTRSVMMTFAGKYRGHAHPHESPWQMWVPLVVLALLATGGGIWLLDTLPEYLAGAIPVKLEHHHESILDSILHSWIGFAGVGLAIVFYTVLNQVPGATARTFPAVTSLLSHKFYFDELYDLAIVRPLRGMANMFWRVIDVNIIDMAVNGSAWFVDANGELIRRPQTGQLRHYAMYMLAATVLVITFCFLL